MKNIVTACIFLFLGCGWGLAAAQGLGNPSICEESLDISTLPQNTSLIKTDLSDLEDYFTCKAAVKEDVQICSIFASDPQRMADCQDAYNRYYATFGKLYRNGRVSSEGLNVCLKSFKTKAACEEFGDILLSGYADNCEKIEGITPENINICKNMASSSPIGSTRAIFMMLLRKGDPGLCDRLENSSVASICKGLLWKNVDGCQLNAGVRRFKKLYCQHLSK